jgi:hypothetical protein
MIGLLLAAAAAWTPGRAEAQAPPAEPIRCLGVQSETSPTLPFLDPIRVDLGSLVLVLEGDVSPHDSTYVVNLVKDLLPEMTEVLGPNGGGAELSIQLGNSGSYYCYSNLIEMPSLDRYPGWLTDDDHDGAIDEDPFDGIDNDGDGAVDEDLPNSPIWDSTLAHELAHAFQGDVICSPYPRWFTEGMAEAAAWFVSERLAAEGGRHLLGSAFDLQLAYDDLLDRMGPQILGGAGRPIDRPSALMAYSAAGGTLLFPCLAEIASGRDRPMARLTEALREDLPSTRCFETVDRVFLSPVDGALPPSRWMQGRSVVCPSVSNGTFLAISHPELPVNPGRIGIMYFSRQGYTTEWLHIDNLPTYTGVYGEKTRATELINVPELTPGAYRVDQREPGEDGSTLTATSWVLIVHDQLEAFRTQTGVAAVFVDAQGNPVDVPGLSVDGTMRERVPGGCLVEPVEGAGSVTFRSGTDLLGTALVVPSRLRMVLFHVVPETSRGVVTWIPYRPRPGDALLACLRRGVSALATDPGPIHAVLQGVPYVQQEAEEVWAGPDDRLYARFTVPPDMEYGEVSFMGSAAEHHSPTGGIVVRSDGGPALIAVHTREGSLFLEFDEAVDPSTLALEIAEDPSGPWTPSENRPVADSGSETRWAWLLPSLPPSGLARVRDLGAAGDGVLCTVLLDGEPAAARAVSFAPFPNPSDLGALWPLELAQSAEADFEVVDVTGRRIHGPERLRLDAGRSELWWDGRARGRRAPAGVYFLRISGPTVALQSRIVLLPR